MNDFLIWLIIVEIISILAFPLCFRFFNLSPERGYAFSKVLGLLVWGYFFWLGNITGLLSNNSAGSLCALLVLALFSWLVGLRKNSADLLTWLKTNKRLVAFSELVFILFFLTWTVVRAANPEIIGTEKPMELAFINSIFQTPSFPPSDPWLSGYAISYYYFGYVLVAAFMHLAGSASGVAFNLAISLTFALVASSSSGLLVSLLMMKDREISDQDISKKQLNRILVISLLAAVMILLLGNAEGFLEMLHSRGFFWEGLAEGKGVSPFWQWLDIKDLSDAPALPLDWRPGRPGGTWWWRASRVLQDYTMDGQSREIINEFPFFSYLLADLHPHVLAMPFVILVIYAGWYFFQFYPVSHKRIGFRGIFDFLKDPPVWVLGFMCGSLLFINTWDFPIYFGLICLSFLFSILLKHGWEGKRLLETIMFAIPLGLVCILLYSPFILSLSSQAGGLLPSLIFRTRTVHFLVMFFPQLIIILGFLIMMFKKAENKQVMLKIFGTILGIALIIWLVSMAVIFLPYWISNQAGGWLARISGINDAFNNTQQGILGIYGANDASHLLLETISRTLHDPILLILLLILTAACIFILRTKRITSTQSTSSPDCYILILVFLATLLALFPEFFYLRDQFGWRMNTIFKFYFQVWVLYSIAAAFALGSMNWNVRKVGRVFLLLIAALGLMTGLVYPLFSLLDKTNSFRQVDWSLDGNRYFELTNPTEYIAIEQLTGLPYGVVAEAVGGSYSGYGRVSRMSGYPTVLGWPGHELQWRGGGTEIGSREGDVRLLFETSDWATAKLILDQYQISYVFIGTLERSTYTVSEDKFVSNLALVFNREGVVIYAYRN